MGPARARIARPRTAARGLRKVVPGAASGVDADGGAVGAGQTPTISYEQRRPATQGFRGLVPFRRKWFVLLSAAQQTEHGIGGHGGLFPQSRTWRSSLLSIFRAIPGTPQFRGRLTEFRKQPQIRDLRHAQRLKLVRGGEFSISVLADQGLVSHLQYGTLGQLPGRAMCLLIRLTACLKAKH